MADLKISQLTHGTVDVANDLIPFVQVADTAQGPAGSTHYLHPSEIATTTTDASALTTGVLAVARLPTTGLTFDSRVMPIGTAVDGPTVTFDLAAHAAWKVTLGGNRTLALSNPTASSPFTIVLQQDGTGSRTVTWWSGVVWSAGTAPTLTTTASKYDVFTFLTVSPGVFLGFVAGQNY